MRHTPLLLLAALLVVPGGALWAEEERTDTPAGLTVHEWGTFTTVSDAAGNRLKFYANDQDLPDFVYRAPLRKDEAAIFVSLETPVLYFYADREMTASVQVDFAKGRMTEWYPHGDESREGGLRWRNFRVLPKAKNEFPGKGEPSRYYAAREVDAAPVRLTVKQDGKEKTEREKFLFYRGVGNCDTPLTVRGLGKGTFAVRNSGKEKLTDVFLVRLHGGKLRFLECGSLEPGEDTTIAEPTEDSSTEKLGAAMVRLLVSQGLYEKEAKAMVKTWSTAWFGEEGTRFLYLMPAPTTDKVLPLRIQPKPSALVRVLVGRHDVVTPEREQEADALMRRIHQSRSEFEQQALRRDMEKQFGRFAWPISQAAEARLLKAEKR